MRIRRITPEDDEPLARLVRDSLKRYGLDIPGTAYFDPELEQLSSYYLPNPRRSYYVLEDEEGRVVGGAGYGEFSGREDCAELQKLYLDPSVQGRGLGHRLLKQVETSAAVCGYRELYLETHHVLKTAIHMYENQGYKRIAPPKGLVHGTMDTFMVKSLFQKKDE